MIEQDKTFETLGFPVDVYWMDIEYSQKKQYFTFSKTDFPLD